MTPPKRLLTRLRGLLALFGLVALCVLAAGGGGPVGLSGAALAQDDGAALSDADYTQWQGVAERAAEAIEQNRASDGALETLRTEIATWRTRFRNGQNANRARIATVRDQLSALGDPPGEGESESDEIAQRRDELTERLNTLRAPVLEAEQAFRHADGLIGQIDTLLLERQTEALMQRGVSPLDPATWRTGLSDLGARIGVAEAELRDNLAQPSTRKTARDNAPIILLLVAAGGFVLLRARRWTDRVINRLAPEVENPQRAAFAAVLSLGQVILPTLGVLALVYALRLSDVAGQHVQSVLAPLPVAFFIFFLARWLGARVFHFRSAERALLPLSDAYRREGRWDAMALGLVSGVWYFVSSVAVSAEFDDATMTVVAFPLVLVAAFLVFRLLQLLRRHLRAATKQAEDATSLFLRLARSVVMMGLLLAVVGPLLAAAGYMQAGAFAEFAMADTLMLVALVALLLRFISDGFELITRGRQQASESLVPIALGAVVILGAAPVLAWIWGARPSAMGEIWSRFVAGFTLGDTHISPGDFLTFALVFAIGYVATRLVQNTMRTTVLPRTKIDQGGQNAMVSGLGYVGIFLAAIIAITTAGIDLSSVAIVAGALSVGIGFGLQTVVSNFVSGIILLIERPVTEGDWIEVGGTMGIVRDISVRATRIETFDRTNVIVPNADLISGTVTNWTRHNLAGRIILPVGVAYGTDTRRVEAILKEIAEAQPLVILNPPPTVVFAGFGADSLDFEVRVVLSDVNFSLGVKTEMNHQIAERFAQEGIEIPFAQRDVWLRNPETLQPAPKPAAPSGETPPNPPLQSDEPATGKDTDES